MRSLLSRLIPASLAGRIAALMLLTLVAAQVLTVALFAGEREASFRSAFHDESIARFASLVDLVEDAPPDLRERLLRATSTRGYRARLDAAPAADTSGRRSGELAEDLAQALARPPADVAVAIREPGDHGEREARPRADRRGPPAFVTIAVRLADRQWLNVWIDRPPVPPLRRAFMAALLASALIVVIVGAGGVALASRPLRRLAEAADRLGRGEAFAPLAETGPRETRQANIAFNRMRERLDRFVRDRTAMLAAIAHDLRTPITSLRLRAEFVDDEEARGKILETLAEMQAMTDAVLAFARGDATAEESRQADLAALAESIVEDLAATGRAVTMIESPALPVRCRPVALRRALANLIENAAVYGPPATIRVERDGETARVVIEDKGPGIPAADLERVFEPFTRLEASRSRETGGVGLGLSIARSILHAHGGDVVLENRAEGGLRATATLPV